MEASQVTKRLRDDAQRAGAIHRRQRGRDAHAAFSIIASCRLHAIDPQQYLDEILRLLPYWPKERYLELAPKHWRATREKLCAKELAAPMGAFTIPAA